MRHPFTHMAAQRSRAQLSELLKSTERVSRHARPKDKAQWYHR